MNGKIFMAAMGNINDRYIMEFADVKPLKKPHSIFVTKILPIAACLCLILTISVLWDSHNNAPKGNIPGETDTAIIVWGDGIGDNSIEKYGDKATKGTIFITDSLKKAMSDSKNDNDRFAVIITELTGASANDVYNKFVKPLGVTEEYLETGIIFITEKQISTLECPSDLSLVLSLAVKPYEDKPVNKETLDTKENSKMVVKVYLKYNLDNTLMKYKEQLSGLDGEDYQKAKQLVVEKDIKQLLNNFIDDYKIPDKAIIERGIYIPKFTAELDTDFIARIIDDQRVELILDLEDANDIGTDQ